MVKTCYIQGSSDLSHCGHLSHKSIKITEFLNDSLDVNFSIGWSSPTNPNSTFLNAAIWYRKERPYRQAEFLKFFMLHEEDKDVQYQYDLSFNENDPAKKNKYSNQ